MLYSFATLTCIVLFDTHNIPMKLIVHFLSLQWKQNEATENSGHLLKIAGLLKLREIQKF